MKNDSDEEFETTYEPGDEDEDDDGGGEAVMETLVVPPAVSQPMDVPLFMRSLDLNGMHAPEFPEYINERYFILFIRVANPKDGKFRIRIEYSYRKSFIAAIQSYTISRGVDHVIYESEPQMFYAKYKTYGHGCDWLIRAA
ncbi:hypothetical protein Ahy_A03g012766 [Arachis hypogaea]|uniref:Transposase MuDR plant domain-containing protein n=1 Tax=Arachis hypogaea TaxID=3818 RepID=A0A445DU28_ARAHY|nr:hypothetical protein Ahy_A03g012766 [Arachis hypogaea]